MELHATIDQEDDGSYWAEVKELPGCFASGHTLDELQEALLEAIEMCLPDSVKRSEQSSGPPFARLDEIKLVTAQSG